MGGMKDLLSPSISSRAMRSSVIVLALASYPALVLSSYAQDADPPRSSPNSLRKSDKRSPEGNKVPPTPHPGVVGMGPRSIKIPEEFRSIDGTGNNVANPDWGSTEQPFLRVSTADYGDGVSEPAGALRPGARVISNEIHDQPQPLINRRGASDFLWQWGQFLDHDITLTPEADPVEPFNIQVPAGDLFFDPQSLGTIEIGLDRSYYEMVNGVREQFNEITAYIDASNVYGSDAERAQALRANDGTGKLLTSAGDLLTFNTEGIANAPTASDPGYFLAGDFRANEQVGLTAMHTLFMREHNYWADVISRANPELSGDQIYESARVIVAAEMQAITYNEFLPLLLGPRTMPRYRGYRDNVDAGIANEFATAGYRIGHTMLSADLWRLDEQGEEIDEGHLSLADAFFNPSALINEGGIDPVLRGLARQPAQEIDAMLVDEVRNFLFGPPGAGGFDLASLNIQRGRDHGLASYSEVREAYGLRPVRRFSDITRNRDLQDRLEQVFDSPADIDLWTGGLCEDHARDAMVGETIQSILREQFARLRDGDRFWYQNYLDRELQSLIERQTLATIIRRNTDISNEIGDNVFLVPRSMDQTRGGPGGRPPGGGRRR